MLSCASGGGAGGGPVRAIDGGGGDGPLPSAPRGGRGGGGADPAFTQVPSAARIHCVSGSPVLMLSASSLRRQDFIAGAVSKRFLSQFAENAFRRKE